MNPYDVLGVAKTATPDQIRAAYRRAASAAHPDRAGGDDAQMARLNQAFEILNDPERRQAFDATGQAEPTQDIEEQALQLFGVAIQEALAQSLQPIIQFASSRGAAAQDELSARRDSVLSQARSMEKRRGTVRRLVDGDNLVLQIMDGQIAEKRAIVRQCEQRLKVITRVRRMLEEYEDVGDDAAQARRFAGFMAFGAVASARFSAGGLL